MNSSPRGPRIVVNHPAELRDANGKAIKCTIVDVSKEGFRLKVPRPMPTGADYSLHFDNEIHSIEVRWASPTEVGGLFLDQANDD